MTRQSRTWIALAEDQSLVSSTYVRWVTAACNARSRGLDALFWPFLAPAEVHNPTPPQNTHENTYLEIKQIFFLKKRLNVPGSIHQFYQ